MNTEIKNPIAETKEYKKALESYKHGLTTYQPGPKWYFGNVEKGISFDGSMITLEQMQNMAINVNPIGPAFSIDEVEDITPSYDEFVKIVGADFSGYDNYTKWIDEQKDAFYYGRGKEDFSRYEAFAIAAKLGYKKVIMENYS